jgi:predicted  nucleic acid-binding Zn-ribbon protein
MIQPPPEDRTIKSKIIECRSKAQHARSLASRITDEAARRALVSYAEDLEKEAATLEQTTTSI